MSPKTMKILAKPMLFAAALIWGTSFFIMKNALDVLPVFFLLAILPCTLLLVFSDGASVYILGDARTQLGLILLVPCLLLTGTENLHKHYFYGTGRVTPAALTELAEQVLKAVVILTLLVVLHPTSPE